MERLFFFCFRSCLKGDSDREYYDILEIDNPNTATTELIKKQYKKLSLSVHPVIAINDGTLRWPQLTFNFYICNFHRTNSLSVGLR